MSASAAPQTKRWQDVSAGLSIVIVVVAVNLLGERLTDRAHRVTR